MSYEAVCKCAGGVDIVTSVQYETEEICRGAVEQHIQRGSFPYIVSYEIRPATAPPVVLQIGRICPKCKNTIAWNHICVGES
jgi:hypothetical protein